MAELQPSNEQDQQQHPAGKQHQPQRDAPLIVQHRMQNRPPTQSADAIDEH